MEDEQYSTHYIVYVFNKLHIEIELEFKKKKSSGVDK